MYKFIGCLLCVIPLMVGAKESTSILHYDITNDKVITGENINVTRPLASITKLMTAMVSLDYSPNLNQKITVKRNIGSRLPPQSYSRSEVFHAMLIRSDNGSAETIASDYPGGRKAFIDAMNRKAQSLGMYNTQFKDPSGLSRGNTSTAIDVSTMLIAAANYDAIKNISVKTVANIDAVHKNRIRTISLPNTNREILFQFDNILVSKTGFTNPAGFCVGLVVEKAEKNRNARHVIVVMGANNTKQRVDKVKSIMYNEII